MTLILERRRARLAVHLVPVTGVLYTVSWLAGLSICWCGSPARR